jgi:hypothetical protein
MPPNKTIGTLGIPTSYVFPKYIIYDRNETFATVTKGVFGLRLTSIPISPRILPFFSHFRRRFMFSFTGKGVQSPRQTSIVITADTREASAARYNIVIILYTPRR